MKPELKQKKRYRRHLRVRAKIKGIARRPRLCVFRSNKHTYAQLINDKEGKTLLSVSDLNLKKFKIKTKQKTDREKNIQKSGKVILAFEVGRLIAKLALEKKIEKVVFDRGGYRYHGRVKALAEGAREEGLKF